MKTLTLFQICIHSARGDALAHSGENRIMGKLTVPNIRFMRRAASALLFLAGALLLAQQVELDEAVKAFEEGKTAEAEQKVQAVLKKQPSNLRALVLGGAVLDSAKRYSEAETYYELTAAAAIPDLDGLIAPQDAASAPAADSKPGAP